MCAGWVSLSSRGLRVGDTLLLETETGFGRCHHPLHMVPYRAVAKDGIHTNATTSATTFQPITRAARHLINHLTCFAASKFRHFPLWPLGSALLGTHRRHYRLAWDPRF